MKGNRIRFMKVNMTKAETVFALAVAVLVASSPLAHAKSSKLKAAKGREVTETPIQYTQSSASVTSIEQGEEIKYAVGFSTVQNAVPGSTAAITGMIQLTPVDTFQAFFTIPSTSPFEIGGAGLYKRTIASSKGAGFHVGGGLGLGSISGKAAGGNFFSMNLSVIGGFHFELPGIPHVVAHLDGGPAFSLVTTDPSTTTNFQVGALSAALGASIVYLF